MSNPVRHGVRAALASLILVLPVAANAATGGGVRIIVQDWSPANPGVQNDKIVLDRPGLLGDALDQGWSLARGPVCTALEKELGKPDRLGSGFTLYDIDCSMAQHGTLSVAGFSDNLLSLTYTLPGNMFKATSTQPSALGKYANPCAFIHYDVTATTAVHLDTLAIDDFNLAISNVSRPDSCNAAGDIAKFAATTLHFFGGPDYLAVAQSAIQISKPIATSKLDAAITSVTGQVNAYTKQYATRTNWIRNGDVYVAFAPHYDPQPLSAGIGGSIAVVKSARLTSAPDCASFSLAGTVQVGPAPIHDPVHMTTWEPPFATVGTGAATGSAIDRGDRYTCAYTATRMPAGVPVRYNGGAGLDRREAGYRMGLLPDGWSGTATLTGFADGKNFIAELVPDASRYNQQYVPNRTIVNDHPNYDNGTLVNPALNQTVDHGNVALNPQPLPPIGSDPNVTNGNALFRRADFAGAAAAFDRAVKANPGNPIALHNLALANARLGNTTLAVSQLRRAASLAHAGGDAATEGAAAKAIIIVGGGQR